MFASGLMTAGALTNLAMMITRAGGQGLEDLAKDPTSLGRNAARFLQTRVGIKAIITHLLLHIQVPLQTKRGIKASRQPLPILPIYEVFAAMFDEKKKQYMKHLEQPDLLCDNFYTHEKVLEYGAHKCFPVRLFIDFGRFDRFQSTLNIYVCSLFDYERIPVGSYHKRLFCKCGCRGAHTFQVIMDAIAWMFRVMDAGEWPALDYYNQEWAPDSWRKQKAGDPLFDGKHAILVEVGGDLDEWAKTCGLSDYRSNYGCTKCFKKKSTFRDNRRAAKRKHQWLVDVADTALQCVPVTEELAQELLHSCAPKKSKGGVVLTRNLSPTLKCGTRLEPACSGMVDFWHGESVRDAPLSQRKALFFQHPKNGILFISRLIYVPNVQPGIPGLILDHFLLDSMYG